MQLKTAKWSSYLLVGITLLLVVLRVLTGWWLWGLLCLLPLIGALLISLIWLRCPVCGRHLRHSRRYCSHCGANLEE